VIAVDTSALIEIIIDADRAEACMEALETADDLIMSAGTLVECLIVASGREAERPLNDLLEQFGLSVEPVTVERARAAGAAYRRYGRGWHAAALNLGDCFAYALAKEYDCPLLFVGEDFRRTDIIPALPRP
jgi:ribonuclease VapC